MVAANFETSSLPSEKIQHSLQAEPHYLHTMATAASGPADVKAELQQYLKEKDLNAIFVSIVEALLIDKPENPIGFILKYLLEKYPEETKSIVESIAAPPADVPDPVEIEHSDEESSDSDSESESMAEDDNLEPSPTGSRRSTKRRASVCAEKLCPVKMEASEVKKIPKTEEEAERIGQILQKNVLFRHLDEKEKSTVQDAMFSVEKEENDVIIKQGDDGSAWYIIDSGSVDVYIESPEEGDKLVASYGDGDSFGELAIMYNAPRAATCIAKGPVRLWALDRVSFKTILMQTAISKRAMHKSFLQQVPVLSQLTEYEVLTIADALQEESFEDGAIICSQGECGDQFYIIKEGAAVCTQSSSTGTSQEVARLGDGSYFGEVSKVSHHLRHRSSSFPDSFGNLTPSLLCSLRPSFVSDRPSHNKASPGHRNSGGNPQVPRLGQEDVQARHGSTAGHSNEEHGGVQPLRRTAHLKLERSRLPVSHQGMF